MGIIPAQNAGYGENLQRKMKNFILCPVFKQFMSKIMSA